MIADQLPGSAQTAETINCTCGSDSMSSFMGGGAAKSAKKAAKKAEELAARAAGKSRTEEQRQTALGERTLSVRARDRGRSLLRFATTLGSAS